MTGPLGLTAAVKAVLLALLELTEMVKTLVPTDVRLGQLLIEDTTVYVY